MLSSFWTGYEQPHGDYRVDGDARPKREQRDANSSQSKKWALNNRVICNGFERAG
jgi:hypothetical protein